MLRVNAIWRVSFTPVRSTENPEDEIVFHINYITIASPKSGSSLPPMKNLGFAVITTLLVFVIIALGGELLVRYIAPQPYLYPRLQYSEDYGFTLYRNTRMVNGIPGGFRFYYTVNEYGYRGIPVPPAPDERRVRIVVLGDSYGFGIGVPDGEEFASVLRSELGDGFDVINLSVGGYGLTQEIRRYYELGRMYRPQVVILQFCANDPLDNLENMVAVVEADSFAFRRTNSSVAWLKQYLSASPIQMSQLYNFLRDRLYIVLSNRKVINARISGGCDPGSGQGGVISPEEEFYCRLLENFARGMHRRGVRFIIISVNGQIDQFPYIRKKVDELNTKKVLEYIEVAPWFEGVEDFGSPEGHSWGSRAHAIIGTHLAKIIRP